MIAELPGACGFTVHLTKSRVHQKQNHATDEMLSIARRWLLWHNLYRWNLSVWRAPCKTGRQLQHKCNTWLAVAPGFEGVDSSPRLQKNDTNPKGQAFLQLAFSLTGLWQMALCPNSGLPPSSCRWHKRCSSLPSTPEHELRFSISPARPML